MTMHHNNVCIQIHSRHGNRYFYSVLFQLSSTQRKNRFAIFCDFFLLEFGFVLADLVGFYELEAVIWGLNGFEM
jgi:hypothetical protein